MKHLPRLILTLLLALFVVACAQGQAAPEPPDISYGETVCEQCNMIISDERFAAGYAYEISPGRYESVGFDDIGDMLENASANPERNVSNWYVHDYQSKVWLDATQAYYMLSTSLPTPMGHGVAACGDRADAERMATEYDGEVMRWDELMTRHEMGMLGDHMPHNN